MAYAELLEYELYTYCLSITDNYNVPYSTQNVRYPTATQVSSTLAVYLRWVWKTSKTRYTYNSAYQVFMQGLFLALVVLKHST